MTKINAVIIIFFTLLTNTISSQTKDVEIKKAIEYFNQRNEVMDLVRNQKWQESIDILNQLTVYNTNDGDLFYLLGLASYETSDYKNAIIALKKSLDLGGTILRGIPTGSAPSNDIMIKIAKAYAKDGDKSNAIVWLQKGFASRYDEKPFLKGSSAFKNFNEDEDFLELFGSDTQNEITRDDAWKKDIDYLIARIKELHFDMDNAVSKEHFEKSVFSLKTTISQSTDEEIVFNIIKLFGTLGSGHNIIIPTSPKIGALKQLPVQFYQFNNGMYIVNAEEGFKKWIGYKVERIENTAIDKALKMTDAINARDNNMQSFWLGPYYLSLPVVLKGLNIIEDSKQVKLTLSSRNGKKENVSLKGEKWNFTGFPKLPKLKTENQPLYLSKTEDFYWSKEIPKHNAMYVQFNLVQQKKELTLTDFNLRLRKDLEQSNSQNLILDLRFNSGGNGSITPPMLKTLIEFEVKNPNGKIFVLMGRRTFSAAQNLLTEITKFTNAILVGEPSGSRPNFIGESGWFKLPYSGLMGLVASQYHQTSKAEDHRKWIAPHIPISQSSTSYFNGKDSALNIIFEIIKSKN